MANQVKRRDVGALILLIALELALLSLMALAFRLDGEDRELATRGPAPIEALTAHWPALGPEPTREPAEAPSPPEPPKQIEPVLETAPQPEPEPVVEIARDVGPAAPVALAMAPTRSLEQRVAIGATPVDVVDPCGDDLCCAAATTPMADAADGAATGAGFEESDSPDRMIIRWPASERDDVVYRVFTLPGRRFVGSSGENMLVHLRKPGDPDCYKIQACDRTGSNAGGPLTICITRRRTWG